MLEGGCSISRHVWGEVRLVMVSGDGWGTQPKLLQCCRDKPSNVCAQSGTEGFAEG